MSQTCIVRQLIRTSTTKQYNLELNPMDHSSAHRQVFHYIDIMTPPIELLHVAREVRLDEHGVPFRCVQVLLPADDVGAVGLRDAPVEASVRAGERMVPVQR